MKPARIEYRYEMRAPAPPAEVFPLLCPVREHDWIATWRCELVYTDSGVAELGCVFVTDDPTRGRCLWTVHTYQPPHCIGFTLVSPDRLVELLTIRLNEEDQGTLLRWERTATVLPAGNEASVRARMDAYDDTHRFLERALAHYLRTGECLRK